LVCICYKVYLLLIERVVEGEIVVFDVLGDAINAILRFMNLDLRIGAADGVDLATLLLLLEDGTLPNAH